MHMTNWSYYDKEMEQEWLHWKSCEAAYDDKWSIYKIWLLREKEQWPNMGRL